MYCPKCGGQISFGKQYCPKCKAPLFGDATPQTPPGSFSSAKKESFWDKMIQSSIQTSAIKKTSRKTYNVIWFAMFVSLAMYMVVLYLVNIGKKSGANAPSVMLPILCVVALVCGAFGFFNMKLQLIPEKLLKLENKDVAAMYIQTVGIISIALFESIAIYGLTLNFMGFSKMTAYPFFAVSALLLIYSRTFTDPAWILIEKHPKFESKNRE